MDIVYLVKPGERNEELRYSLRSLALVPHNRVWIVGYRPAWLRNVEHIPSSSRLGKWGNLPVDLLAAARHPGISERFAYWNDDIFALEAMDAVPVRHRGALEAHANTHAPSPYQLGKRQTAQLLRRWGIADPLNYELHIPLVMDKATLCDAIPRAQADRRIAALAYRSLYGNVAGVGGEPMADVKIVNSRQPIPAGWPFVSTSDGSFASGRVGKEIRQRFPLPSPYEASR